jgi:WD40 repeat protein
MSQPGYMSVPTWPVFICYRQSDGRNTAERLFALLHGLRIPRAAWSDVAENAPALDVYFDQAAPGVGDWTAVHEPYLKRARAFLVVCTPGAKLVEGPHDWVHREINWWLENRHEPPILIDALGEGERYVPAAIVEKWPNAQRIPVIVGEWAKLDETERHALEQRTQSRIVGGIAQSGQNVYRRELEQEQARTRELTQALATQTTLARRLKRAFFASTVLFFIALFAAGYGLWQRQVSETRRISALSGELGAISQLMVDRSSFQWELAALLAVEALRRRPNFELVNVAQRLTVSMLKPSRTFAKREQVDSFAVSADGTVVATAVTAGENLVIAVSTVADGQVRSRTTLRKDVGGTRLMFDPTGETLIIRSHTDAFAWRWGRAQSPRKLPGFRHRQLVPSRHGRWLAVLSQAGVHIADLRGEHQDRLIAVRGAHSAVFSPSEADTLFLAPYDQPGSVSIIDVVSGLTRRTIFVTRMRPAVAADGRRAERGVGIGQLFVTRDGHLIAAEDPFVMRHTEEWHLHVWSIQGEPRRVGTIARSEPALLWKISEDGAYVFGVDDAGGVAVYEVATAGMVRSRKFAQAVHDVDVSSDGNLVAVAASGDTAILWDWRSNEIVGRGASESAVGDAALAGSKLWALSHHAALKTWDLPDNPERNRIRFTGSIEGLAQARDADVAIVWTRFGELTFWRPSSAEIIGRASPQSIREAQVSDDGRVAIVLTDFHVYVFIDGTERQRIALPAASEETWSESGQRERWIRHEEAPQWPSIETVPVIGFTRSPESDRRRTVTRKTYWSTAAPGGWHRRTSAWRDHGGLELSLALRPDGKEFAVSVLDWIIRYDPRSARPLSRVALGYTTTPDSARAEPPLRPASVRGMGYGPGNALWIATIESDVWQWTDKGLNRYGRWDVAGITDRGVVVRTRDGKGMTVLGAGAKAEPVTLAGNGAAITRDGSRIASFEYVTRPGDGSRDATQFTFTVAGLAPGYSSWTKRHGAARLSQSAFSADGLLVAIGDEIGSVRVWRVEDGAEVVRLSRPGAITHLAFTHDRNALMVASEQHPTTLYVVPLNVTDLIDDLCSRISRDLTKFEWNEYLSEEPYRGSCSGLSGRNGSREASLRR